MVVVLPHVTTTAGRNALSDDAALDRLLDHPHRRYNPLADEWMLVSPDRTQRPWQGSRETDLRPPSRLRYDPDCYLCPGNRRASGEVNGQYGGTYVFTNDFAALQPDAPLDQVDQGLLRAEGEQGTCRVVCFSPRHDVALGQLAADELRTVVDLWAAQTDELGRQYRWVQVFENRGELMGASNPHPHGQIWAGTALPREGAREQQTQLAYWTAHSRTLLGDYADQEAGGPRVVAANDDWLAVVPFWAVWPFETLLIARGPACRLPDLDDARRNGLVDALRDLLGRYDGLFDHPFPYSMGWHQAPFDGAEHPEWRLHAHAYPPLLRSASVRKFMVGYELLAEPQRDLTPEDAAARLRALPVRDGVAPRTPHATGVRAPAL